MTTFRIFRSLSSAKHLKSGLCQEADFSAGWYKKWAKRIAGGAPDLPDDQQAVWGAVWAGMRGKWMHRKLWEWCAIAQALDERGMLRQGMRGVGFAVGQEPLASLFASAGASILATDLADSADSDVWNSTGQLAATREGVHWPGLISMSEFNRLLEFQNVDMRDLSGLPRERYDFAWSSCSFEHLGNSALGMEFVLKAMDLVRRGGIAVHTTEFNVTSNDCTVNEGSSVIYRRRDIEDLDRSLRTIGCGIESMNFDPGILPADLNYDRAPYYLSGHQHVKLELGGHVTTSILLIIQKG